MKDQSWLAFARPSVRRQRHIQSLSPESCGALQVSGILRWSARREEVVVSRESREELSRDSPVVLSRASSQQHERIISPIYTEQKREEVI